MSDQMQQRNGVKKTVAKRENNSKAKVNKGIHDRKTTDLRTGLNKANKKPMKKVAHKQGQHTPISSSRIDWR